jgi:hypothetical protein
LIVTVGKNSVAGSLCTPASAGFGWTAIGTGGAGPALADTQLGTEAARVANGPSASGNVATFTATYGTSLASGAAINEAGLFNVVTAAGGIMLSHVVFATVNKGATDTLVITWTVTCG